MMQAYELQTKKKDQTPEKSFSLKTSEPQENLSKEDVGLLVRKYYKKLQQGPRKATSSFTRTEAEKDSRRSEKQCLECEGYGHFKADCPTLKKKNVLRCYECKGLGHTRTECVRRLESKQKSYVTWSESDSDEEENAGEELLNNFIAHFGIIEEGEDSDTSSIEGQIADTDAEEIVTTDDHIKLLMNLVEKGKENLDLIAERENLMLRISTLENELNEEKNKNSGLEKQLSDQIKNIRMLSKGTKDLDNLLSQGRVGSTPWGLGYKGGASSVATKFVKGKESVHESSKKVKISGQGQGAANSRQGQYAGYTRQGQYAGYARSQIHESSDTQFYHGMKCGPARNQMQSRSRRRGCWYCGDLRHYKADCYSLLNRQNQLSQQRMQQRPVRQEYVRKEDLYCQVAYIAEESVVGQKSWYFDSGCSRHMTGDQGNLHHLEKITAGRVIFGDGSRGEISGHGVVDDQTQPSLGRVHLVDGLKANLISISQLCDDGLDVTFTRNSCKAVDDQGFVRLEGQRSENNCYMWRPNEVGINIVGISKGELSRKESVLQWEDHKAVSDGHPKTGCEVIHLNSMGQVHVELQTRQRSMSVLIDGFSLWTWVRNLCEISDTQMTMRRYQVENILMNHHDMVYNMHGDVHLSNTLQQMVTDAPLYSEQDPVRKSRRRSQSTMIVGSATQAHRNHSFHHDIGEIQEGRVTRRSQLVEQHHDIGEIQEGRVTRGSQLVEQHQNITRSWSVAMQGELQQYKRDDMWNRVPIALVDAERRPQWMHKSKLDEMYQSVIHKTSLVAQGYYLADVADSEKVFPPVDRLESIRILFGIACILNIKLHQLDVRGSSLLEKTYAESVSRAWYERLAMFLINQGYERGGVDKTVFVMQNNNGLMVVQVYVEGIIFGSTRQKFIDQFMKDMTHEFDMSVCEELTNFLGLQIRQDDDGIFVSQSTYAKSLVEKFGLKTSKESKIPMGVNDKLSNDESGEDVDEKLYRGMIGSLLYLTASRPDLCLSVGICARYQGKPKMSHLLAVKKIIKYVKGTVNLGIYYTKDTNKNLVGYCDADWAGSVDDRRSTSGGCFFMGNNLISWHSKKQNSVSLSTAEAEYIALGSCCTQLMWMKQMAADYGMFSDSLLVHCDNKSAINISKNPVQHSRTKHIDIRHHFIRELVEAKLIVVDHVSTDFQLADLFTKPLDFNRFVNLRKSIGVCEI